MQVSQDCKGAQKQAVLHRRRRRRRRLEVLSHRVGLGIHTRWAPAHTREALRGVHSPSRQLQVMIGACKVQAEDLRVTTRRWCHAGDREPTQAPVGSGCLQKLLGTHHPQRRTSSTLLVEKLRSIAPATLPAAKKGPVGQKDSVAERSTLLMTPAAGMVARCPCSGCTDHRPDGRRGRDANSLTVLPLSCRSSACLMNRSCTHFA